MAEAELCDIPEGVAHYIPSTPPDAQATPGLVKPYALLIKLIAVTAILVQNGLESAGHGLHLSHPANENDQRYNVLILERWGFPGWLFAVCMAPKAWSGRVYNIINHAGLGTWMRGIRSVRTQ